MPLTDIVARHHAVQRELGAFLESDEQAQRHPITRKLVSGKTLTWFLGEFDALLERARSARGFSKLVKKLRDARTDSSFLDAVSELTVCARLLEAGCSDVEVLDADDDERRPDFGVTVGGDLAYVEVTRRHGNTPRQRAYLDRIDRLCETVRAIPSPFYITFYPGAEYADHDIGTIVDMVKKQIRAYITAESITPGALVPFHSDSPPFRISTSLKGEHLREQTGTFFSVGTDLVFLSDDNRESRTLLDTVSAKYGQLAEGSVNVLVIHAAADPLEERAFELEGEIEDEIFGSMLEGRRPKLTTVFVLSSWPGRSTIRVNPAARPALPDAIFQMLRRMAAFSL